MTEWRRHETEIEKGKKKISPTIASSRNVLSHPRWPRKSFEFNPGYDKWQTSSTSRIGRRLTALCTADRYSYNETERLMDLKHEFLRSVFREWNIPFRLRKNPANRHFNIIREQLCVGLNFTLYIGRIYVAYHLSVSPRNTQICSRELPYIYKVTCDFVLNYEM